ncbi:MAG: zf-TFIIB domain-containing protein [Akkermansiaceae bacterium]|nr:zf-TFIIB domain-containing protein [Akkermansiaceae bacterium]
MKCPRDRTPFEQTLARGHQVYRCPQCRGLYMPANTIDPLLGSGEMLKLRSLCSVKQSNLACPFDGKPLGEGKIGAVTVDLCLACNALWLDWGELQLLQKRRPLTPHRPAAAGKAPDSDHDSGLFEAAILIALGSILD